MIFFGHDLIAAELKPLGVFLPEAAVPIVIGANIRPTSKVLLLSYGISGGAQAAAKANFLFNAAGLLLFFPFLQPFENTVVVWAGEPGIAVAWAHLNFNLITTNAFLVTLPRLEPYLRKLLLKNLG